jgi:hypothetical protein
MLRVEFKGQSQAQRQKADTEGQKGSWSPLGSTTHSRLVFLPLPRLNGSLCTPYLHLFGIGMCYELKRWEAEC